MQRQPEPWVRLERRQPHRVHEDERGDPVGVRRGELGPDRTPDGAAHQHGSAGQVASISSASQAVR